MRAELSDLPVGPRDHPIKDAELLKPGLFLELLGHLLCWNEARWTMLQAFGRWTMI